MPFGVQTEKFTIIMHPEDGATSDIESLATSDEIESSIISEMKRLRMRTIGRWREVPPIPQAVLELVEKGLDHVYKAMMRRDFGRSVVSSSFAINAAFLSLQATCSYSTMSAR
ncbi:G-type lectin S-receptor-like serine/threonine-protein kinase [Acorus calamus]|uniref:G-type lectin S-receptor-like serine/threonine-protein kinase n=1 Tax=Acorus calamus TaxID=4465 RepID=A0AAV9CD15_ACOCL|nr:G-type lectin S-receptor-like serine/threonine-protein kinase [Acorus calamus]